MNLVHPLRPGRLGFMAPQTLHISELDDLDIRIVRVRLADAVARFAGNGLVLELGHLVEKFRMALITGLLARKYHWPVPQFLQGSAPVPSELTEGGGLVHVSGREIGHDDSSREKQQSGDLGWSFKGHNFLN
jgi:hypothetical protein